MTGEIFDTAAAKCGTDGDTTLTTCSYPQIQALIILVNENDDCSSSMICKDAMKALIDVKGMLDCSSGTCVVSSPIGNWNRVDTTSPTGTAVSVDQSVSSGFVTVAATTDYVDRTDVFSSGTTLKDLCT